jgi:hypothetical protein
MQSEVIAKWSKVYAEYSEANAKWSEVNAKWSEVNAKWSKWIRSEVNAKWSKWMRSVVKWMRSAVKVFVEWVYHVFIVMNECYCIVCGSFVWVFALKLFVLCHSPFVMLQSNETIILLTFELLFYTPCLLFLCSVIWTISPYAYCCSCPLCKTARTTASGWKPNCNI